MTPARDPDIAAATSLGESKVFAPAVDNNGIDFNILRRLAGIINDFRTRMVSYDFTFIYVSYFRAHSLCINVTVWKHLEEGWDGL